MMSWNYGNMMGGEWGAFAFLGLLFWIVIFIDTLLLGIWLWQQIQRRK